MNPIEFLRKHPNWIKEKRHIASIPHIWANDFERIKFYWECRLIDESKPEKVRFD